MSSGCIVLFVHASGMRGMCRVGALIGEHTTCHGLSPGPPCLSNGPTHFRCFGLTSDPTGSSVYFSFSLMDSRMLLLSFLLGTLNSP